MTDKPRSIHDATRERVFHPGETFQPTISVGRESLPIAIQHGLELWWDESTPTARLDDRDGSSKFTRFVNGRIEGKLAEVAFMEFLEMYFNLRSQVDWRIYGDYEITDDGDLEYLLDDDNNRYELGIDFDLKKTKPWNSWLAVRSEIFAMITDDAPIVLSKMRIEDDIQLDHWQHTKSWEDVDSDDEFRRRLLEFADDAFPVEVELVGSVYKHEFTDHFNKGERLYDPHTGSKLGPNLKRDNEGIHVDRLNATPGRWNRVVADLASNLPKDSWRPLPIVDDISN